MVLNEVNTLPGMTSYSRYPRMMAAAGLPLAEVIDRMVSMALAREAAMNGEFVFVDELVPGIRWDAKYATWDNFTGKPVDGYLANRIVGTRALCAALAARAEAAASLGFGLLLWDGYRPQRAVDCFLRWAQQPEDGRTKRRHYPNIDRAEMFEQGYVAARSGHSRGSTVDLTLYHLATGELARDGRRPRPDGPGLPPRGQGVTPVRRQPAAACARSWRRAASAPTTCEWWHYTLEDEPFPDTYFDFPITSARDSSAIGALGKSHGSADESVTPVRR